MGENIRRPLPWRVFAKDDGDGSENWSELAAFYHQERGEDYVRHHEDFVVHYIGNPGADEPLPCDKGPVHAAKRVLDQLNARAENLSTWAVVGRCVLFGVFYLGHKLEGLRAEQAGKRRADDEYGEAVLEALQSMEVKMTGNPPGVVDCDFHEDEPKRGPAPQNVFTVRRRSDNKPIARFPYLDEALRYCEHSTPTGQRSGPLFYTYDP